MLRLTGCSSFCGSGQSRPSSPGRPAPSHPVRTPLHRDDPDVVVMALHRDQQVAVGEPLDDALAPLDDDHRPVQVLVDLEVVEV